MVQSPPKLKRFYHVSLLYQILHRLRNDATFSELVYSKTRDQNGIRGGAFIRALMEEHPELTDEEYIRLSFGNDAVLAFGKVGPKHSVTSLMVKIYNIHPTHRTKDENTSNQRRKHLPSRPHFWSETTYFPGCVLKAAL